MTRPGPSMTATTAFIRARWPLFATGIACELIYLLYFVQRFPLVKWYHQDIDMGQIDGHTHPGFWAFILCVVALFILFRIAWWQVRNTLDRATLWLILGFGALFAVTMTFTYPITAIDIFAYVDQSLIMVHYHANPIFVAPAHFPNDPVMKLSDGWATNGAPYGPLGIVIDALPTFFTQGNLLANLILLKLMFSAMAMVGAFLVYQVLRPIAPPFAVSGALLVAWNPLILIEVSANGHNDIVMMLFVLLGVLSFAEKDSVMGVILITASALVKYATVLLLPLFLLYGAWHQPSTQKRARFLTLAIGGSVLLAVVAYAPFWQGFETINKVQSQEHFWNWSFSSMLGYSSSNDGFMNHWFSLESAKSLTHALLSPRDWGATMSAASHSATILGRVLFFPIYVFSLWLCTRRLPDLLRASFLATFFVLAFGLTNVLSWYAIWPVVLAAATPRLPERLAALLLSYGMEIAASFYAYFWWWNGVTTDAYVPVNNSAYLISYVPAMLVLVGFALWDRVPDVRGFLPRPRALRPSKAA